MEFLSRGGQNSDGVSSEERDLIQCSTKKIKRDEIRGSRSVLVNDEEGFGKTADPGDAGEFSYVGVLVKGSQRRVDDNSFIMEYEEDEGREAEREGSVSSDSESEYDSEEEDIMQELEEDITRPEVFLTKEEKKEMRRPWRHSVIIKLLGMGVGYHFLSKQLNLVWKPVGTMNIVDVGNDFYMVRFARKEDYRKVITEGPWVINDHYLVVRKWHPDFFGGSQD